MGAIGIFQKPEIKNFIINMRKSSEILRKAGKVSHFKNICTYSAEADFLVQNDIVIQINMRFYTKKSASVGRYGTW